MRAITQYRKRNDDTARTESRVNTIVQPSSLFWTAPHVSGCALTLPHFSRTTLLSVPAFSCITVLLMLEIFSDSMSYALHVLQKAVQVWRIQRVCNKNQTIAKVRHLATLDIKDFYIEMSGSEVD